MALNPYYLPLFGIVCGVLLITGNVQGQHATPENFQQYPTTHTVLQGGTVMLPCVTVPKFADRAETLLWIRSGTILFPLSNFPRYQVTGNAADGDYSLTITDADYTEDDAEWRCQVTTGAGAETAYSPTGNLQVQVRPTGNPSCTQDPSGDLTENASVDLTCSSSGGRPPAGLSWTSGSADATIPTPPTQTPGDDPSLVASLTVDRNYNNVQFTCTAQHPAMDNDRTCDVTLSVLYAPSKPTCSAPQNVILGQTTPTLTCVPTDGNPAPDTYTWKKGGTNLPSDPRYQYDGGSLTITSIVKEDTGSYSCVASNSQGGEECDAVILTVQYAAENADITCNPADASQHQESSPLECTCTAIGVPAVNSFTWTKDGSTLPTGVSTTEGGAKLEFSSLAKVHTGTYRCAASNGIGAAGTADVSITVRYAPKATTVEASPSATREEGEGITLTCTADAEPAASYSWTRVGGSLPTGANVVGGSLQISQLNRADSGDYKCTADNNISPNGEDTVTVDVQYPPSVDTFTTDSNPAEENSPVTLTCTVDSNPAPTSISIVRVGTAGDVTLATGQGRTLSHTIQDVSYTDRGTYRCQAGNGIGTDATRDLELLVNYVPVFVGVRDKYAVAKGDPVSMTCNVTAYPTPVTFYWSKDGGSVPGTATVTDEGLGSTLNYIAVTEADYGFYNCTAGNAKGSRSTVIELASESAPEASTDLIVTMKNSSRYVTVQWTAGFNGGEETTHTVQYRTGGGAWQDGPDKIELASEDHPLYTMTFQLPEKVTYNIRVRAMNGFRDPATGLESPAESNVVSVIIEDAKTLYGSLPLTSETFSNDLKDLQSTAAVQLTTNIITELDNVFDGILGYEKSTITGYSEGSVVAAFQSVVGESESESAQAAFRTSLTGDQLGDWTVDEASIGDKPPTADRDNTTVIIIAVVVFGVVLLAIIIVTVVVVRRKKSAKKQPAENYADNMALDHVRGDADDGYQSLRIPHRQTSDHTYQGLTARSDNELTSDGTYEDVKTPSEFPRNQLDIKEELGHGEFGSVYKAEARKISGISGTTVVAVKELKGMTSSSASTAFFKELSVLKLIGTHPNVVSFLGCCTDAEPFYLLLEFVSGGSLQSALRTSRTQQTYGNLHGGSKSLSSRDLTKFAWDVAKGMSFLSAKKILHRDLATRNVLMSADRTCKVSDFGFSREGDEYERTTKTRLPVRWMAPESLFHRKYTTKSDVWAFGVLLWEIVTLGGTPYPGMSKREVMDGVQQGYRMDKPPHCDEKLYTLMLSCWDADPARRPEFRKIERTLDKLMETEHDYINLASLDENTYTSLQNAADEKC